MVVIGDAATLGVGVGGVVGVVGVVVVVVAVFFDCL